MSAIEKLKDKHPTTLLTVKEFVSVFSMMGISDDEKKYDNTDWVQRRKEGL